MHEQTHARFFSHIHSFTLTVFTAARATDGKTREARRRGKVPQNIIKAVGLGPLATSIPLTGVTCLPNKQATEMSEKWKWGLEVAWPVKRSLVSKLAYLWGLWRYFSEMRRLRATPGLQECLAEFVLCYSPQASQAALVVSSGHPGSRALMGSF